MRLAVMLSTVGVMLALRPPVHAQPAEPQLPVSLERIRAALEQPPSIVLPSSSSGERPTFRVEVREQFFDLEPPAQDEPFDPTFGLPSAGELLMTGIDKTRAAIVGFKRRRAGHKARKEVDDALAAFCAVHGCPPGTSKAH